MKRFDVLMLVSGKMLPLNEGYETRIEAEFAAIAAYKRAFELGKNNYEDIDHTKVCVAEKTELNIGLQRYHESVKVKGCPYCASEIYDEKEVKYGSPLVITLKCEECYNEWQEEYELKRLRAGDEVLVCER